MGILLLENKLFQYLSVFFDKYLSCCQGPTKFSSQSTSWQRAEVSEYLSLVHIDRTRERSSLWCFTAVQCESIIEFFFAFSLSHSLLLSVNEPLSLVHTYTFCVFKNRTAKVNEKCEGKCYMCECAFMVPKYSSVSVSDYISVDGVLRFVYTERKRIFPFFFTA